MSKGVLQLGEIIIFYSIHVESVIIMRNYGLKGKEKIKLQEIE
ncbi:hypothetical protein SAMN02745158_00604 [Lactonifactor longoviformis DSM 17459]|uniref:Uncharacterized protein n=2 Tax=Lactonifactor TaxID=420345 RepID=A0A1M4TVC6_9CLOT|nr:hypothetical protein SAMN02745158_00604 [Lactonifactor longoviformis DSM 17459]